jgi:hypothetical protein
VKGLTAIAQIIEPVFHEFGDSSCPLASGVPSERCFENALVSMGFEQLRGVADWSSERFVPTPVRNAPIARLAADAFPPRAYEGCAFGMNELRVQT